MKIAIILFAALFSISSFAKGSSFTPKKLDKVIEILKEEIKKKESHEDSSAYGIIVNSLNPFWTSCAFGGQAAANELKVTNSFQGPVKSADVEIQKDLLLSMIQQGYAGVAISPVAPDKLVPTFKEAAKKNVNIIAIDSDLPQQYRHLYVGTDNYKAGVEAGKALVKVLGKNGGKVVGTVGNILALNSTERIRGITDGIKGSKVELISVMIDENNIEKAVENSRSALKSHPDLRAIITIYSYNGPAALKALKEADKLGKVKVVSFDLATETMQGLKDGNVSAAVGQRSFYWGKLSVYILHAMKVLGPQKTKELLAPFMNGESKDILDTEIDIVTPANLKDYQNYLASQGIKSQ